MEVLNNLRQCKTWQRKSHSEFHTHETERTTSRKMYRGTLFSQPVTIHVLHLTSLVPDMSSFLWLESGKCSISLRWIETYGNPIIAYMLLIS
jgi:hypothetical protein